MVSPFSLAIHLIAALPPPVRKASGFPFVLKNLRGFASCGVAAKRVAGLPESLRLSEREAQSRIAASVVE
jgi:hypothetical protein